MLDRVQTQTHHFLQQLLDVEDVCGAKKPDERSVMTYIAQYFHAFSSSGESNLSLHRLLCWSLTSRDNSTSRDGSSSDQ